ncbi:transposable element Tcb2 transposase [Trichonephila clavipes]|nr:transposable element Tcb2 transposase [Trichonephila clavipes]
MINSRTRLHVVANGTMTGQRYIDEVLLPHVLLFCGAVGDKFVFMDDNATCHRTLAVHDCLDSEGIQRLVWPARSPDLNPFENVWDALGRQAAGRNYPPTNKNTLIRALTEEWDKLPQQLLDNVVQSMKLLGAVDTRRVPTRGKPGLERPGKPRGEKIVRQALVDPTVTRSTIRADVGVAIVPQTISRHLAEANLKSKRPFPCIPFKTGTSATASTVVLKVRSMWNVTDWQNVVFSDESRFVLETDDNRVRVCRHPGAIFQQDNARPHTARVAPDFLRHFQTLPWPDRSPDLSLADHVWYQLKRQMPSCHSVHDLELAVQDLWAHLPQDNIRCIIN